MYMYEIYKNGYIRLKVYIEQTKKAESYIRFRYIRGP